MLDRSTNLKTFVLLSMLFGYIVDPESLSLYAGRVGNIIFRDAAIFFSRTNISLDVSCKTLINLIHI